MYLFMLLELNHIFVCQQSINLLGNDLREIKNSTFWKYPLLESLSLSFNKIENIEDNSFEYLEKLESIDLWNNKLTRFDQRFSKSIRFISLKNNPLTYVNISTANVANLAMTNCSLTRLPNLGPLPKLAVLSVYDNNFEEISTIDIAPFCYLDKFNVRSSEFKNTKTYESCECEKLRFWLRKKRINDNNVIKCSTNLSCSTDEFDFSKEEELWDECMNIRKERHLRV